MFRKVSTPTFKEFLAASDASQLFRKQYARYISFVPLHEHRRLVNDGDVHAKSFKAPGLCTLILGDLIVDDVVDLQTPYDEGRLFIVIGNIGASISSTNTAPIVSSTAISTSQSILNGFEDASLNVIGDLKTKLFIGCDIWAEVGGATDMDSASATRCRSATPRARQAMRPRHARTHRRHRDAKGRAPRLRARCARVRRTKFAPAKRSSSK